MDRQEFLQAKLELLQKELRKKQLKSARTPQPKPVAPKPAYEVDASLLPGLADDTTTPHKTSRSNRPLKSPKYLIEPAKPATNARLPEPFRSCKQALAKLMKHQFANMFSQPVDWQKMGLLDYPTIIRFPMDLGTVRRKLLSLQYDSKESFMDDVEQVWANAMTYNPPGHDVYHMALKLKQLFDREAEHLATVEASPPEPKVKATPAPRKSKARATPETKASPKPVAGFDGGAVMVQEVEKLREQMAQLQNELVKTQKKAPATKKTPKKLQAEERPLTFEEKTELKDKICALPEEKLRKVIDLVSKSNPPKNANGEIEIDFDLMSIPLLRKLQKFVQTANKPRKRRQSSTTTPEPKRQAAEPAYSPEASPPPLQPAYSQPSYTPNNNNTKNSFNNNATSFGTTPPVFHDDSDSSSSDSSDEEEHTNDILPPPSSIANSQIAVDSAAWQQYAKQDDDQNDSHQKDSLWTGMQNAHAELQMKQKKEQEERERFAAEQARQQQLNDQRLQEQKAAELRKQQELQQQEFLRQQQMLREREEAAKALIQQDDDNGGDSMDIWGE